MNKKIVAVLGISIMMFSGCGKSEKTNETGPVEVFEPVQYHITAEKLDDKSSVGNEILSKDVNAIVIWQASCPPCESEAQAIKKVKLDDNAQFIGLGVGESDALKNAQEKWGVDYDNYRASDKFIEKNSDTIKSTPTILFLDKEGKEIIPKKVGYEETTVEEGAASLKEDIQKAEKALKH